MKFEAMLCAVALLECTKARVPEIVTQVTLAELLAGELQRAVDGIASAVESRIIDDLQCAALEGLIATFVPSLAGD